MNIDQNALRFFPSDLDEDDDDDMDWEEVEVQADVDLSADTDDGLAKPSASFNVVLSKSGANSIHKPKNPNSAIERRIRHETHRARLLSIVPISLVNAFSSYSPQTHPLARDRSRLFDSAMKDLVSWWWQSFEIVESLEGVRLRTWAEAEALFTRVSSSSSATAEVKGKAKAVQDDPFLNLLETGEPIHSSNSLMKRAVIMKGSREISAQLFTSLLRALDVPARLVFSLQPVTWRGAGGGGKSSKIDTLKHVSVQDTRTPSNPTGSTSKGVEKPGMRDRSSEKNKAPQAKMLSVASQASKIKRKRGELITKAAKAAKAAKMKTAAASATSSRHYALPSREGTPSGEEDTPLDRMFASSHPDANRAANSSPKGIDHRNSWRSNPSGKVSKLVPVVKLRKARPTKSKHWTKSPSPEPRQMNRPPVFWTEVYSRSLKEWYCVDVTRKRIRCKTLMEPTKTNPENRMTYVIAFEEDNFVRDVTARYAHSFGATTIKARLPTKKGSLDWFEQATAKYKRPYKLVRDEKEDEEILKAQVTEALPTTVGGFKDHPNFALERHLRREEVIYPRKSTGTFRGEPVFPRSAVVVCKSAEAYMRVGRRIKGGEEPLKLVKPRTVTINRKREEELLKMDGQEVAQQGLFAEWQTENLIPPPIVDGIIPRNGYGNFDLFAPHMLPEGAVHLPYVGISKTAKRLGVSYADAVVSFAFKKRRAVPVIDGIVVAEKEHEFVLDAYWASEDMAQEKEFAKLQERCLKRWKKIIRGLRIKRRLKEEYQNQALTSEAIAPKDGPSELESIDVQPQEIDPVPFRVNVPLNRHPKPPDAAAYELYTDHRVNTMAMPGPSKNLYIDGHKRGRSASVEAQQEVEQNRAAFTHINKTKEASHVSPEHPAPMPTELETPLAHKSPSRHSEEQQAIQKSGSNSSSSLSSPPAASNDEVASSNHFKAKRGRLAKRDVKVVVQEITGTQKMKSLGQSSIKISRAETLRASKKVRQPSIPSDRKLRPRK